MKVFFSALFSDVFASSFGFSSLDRRFAPLGAGVNTGTLEDTQAVETHAVGGG